MAETDSARVLVSEQRGAVQVLRLNRPEARNAHSPELVSQIGLGLIQAEEDPAVRAVPFVPAWICGASLKARVPLKLMLAE
jgi:enoyl-CoA hydratase/carnithine racemase